MQRCVSARARGDCAQSPHLDLVRGAAGCDALVARAALLQVLRALLLVLRVQHKLAAHLQVIGFKVTMPSASDIAEEYSRTGPRRPSRRSERLLLLCTTSWCVDGLSLVRGAVWRARARQHRRAHLAHQQPLAALVVT